MIGSREAVRVLYEDNHLLGLYKPAGMLVQGDRTGDYSLLEWAKDYIRARYAKPGEVFVGLVHRLDRPVAGVVLLARTSKAARRLSEQFRERSCRKLYWAVAVGTPRPAEGALTSHMVWNGKRALIVPAEHPGAKEAGLRYRTLERRDGLSLLEVELLSGRHHQIRLQLSSIGCPILGDRLYGGRAKEKTGPIALLAYSLTVRHPTRGEAVTLVSPFPGDWPWPRGKGAEARRGVDSSRL